MTNKESIERNIGLTFDFVEYLIDNPSITETLPDNFEAEFIEKDFSHQEKAIQSKTDSHLNRKIVRVKNAFELTK